MVLHTMVPSSSGGSSAPSVSLADPLPPDSSPDAPILPPLLAMKGPSCNEGSHFIRYFYEATINNFVLG